MVDIEKLTIASEPLGWIGKSQRERNGALSQCTAQCCSKELDTADIVRDGDFATVMGCKRCGDAKAWFMPGARTVASRLARK